MKDTEPLLYDANLPAEPAPLSTLHHNDGGRSGTPDMPTLSALARRTGQTRLQTMISYLENNRWPRRFIANRSFFSATDRIRLLKSTVAVMGLGKRGGMVALLLARYGIGKFILCDQERFTEENLTGQYLCSEQCIGMNKACGSRDELLRIASHAEYSCFSGFSDSAHLAAILQGADVVIDCLGKSKDRPLLHNAALSMGMTLIHSSAKERDGFVLISAPERQTVTRFYGTPTYSPENSPNLLSDIPNLGSAFIGGLQAHAAIKTILRQEGKTASFPLDLPDLEYFAL